MATRLYTITDSADFLLFEGVTGYSSAGEQFAIQKSNIVKIKVINLAIPSSSGVGISMVDQSDYAFSYTELVDPATGLPFVNLATLLTTLETLTEQTSSGGGSAITADGDTMYSNVSGEFTAIVDPGTKDIIVAGTTFLAWDETNVVSLQLINTTPELITLPLSGITVALGVITVTDAEADFVLGDKVIVTLQGPKKAYSVTYDAVKTLTQNPEYAHTTVPQVLANALNTELVVRLTAQNAVPGAVFENDGSVTQFGEYNIALGYSAANLTTGGIVAIPDGITEVIPNTSITGILDAGDWTAGDEGVFSGLRRWVVDMDTYKYLTIHYRLISNSISDELFLRVYGSNDVNASVSSLDGWVDMSLFFLGVAEVYANDDSQENIVMPTFPVTLQKLMIQLVGSTDSVVPQDIEYTLIVKKA